MSSRPDKLGNGWRFHVMRIEGATRIFIEDEPSYVNACTIADIHVQSTNCRHIVWDTLLKKKLYDSKLLGLKMTS